MAAELGASHWSKPRPVNDPGAGCAAAAPEAGAGTSSNSTASIDIAQRRSKVLIGISLSRVTALVQAQRLTAPGDRVVRPLSCGTNEPPVRAAYRVPISVEEQPVLIRFG
jgi:hypothetical protein